MYKEDTSIQLVVRQHFFSRVLSSYTLDRIIPPGMASYDGITSQNE